MHKAHDPAKVFFNAKYAQGVEVPPGARWLHISGQVGRDAHGVVAEGIEAQAELASRNLVEVLKAAEMDLADLVHVTLYLTRREDNGGYDRARSRILGDLHVGSTKVYVSGLADPAMRCEIQAVAARAA